jgi:sugar phosphate isomerase/epimerase
MKQTLERAVERAAAHHVSIAIEVMNDPRFDAATLVTLLEEDFEDLELGICLDFGHAHLRGDLCEAIETVSGHMVTTHLHDNAGRQDDHRVPYGGTIHWDSAMMEVQKIGYDGVLLFEPAAVKGDPVVVLKRCVAARDRLERTFVTF